MYSGNSSDNESDEGSENTTPSPYAGLVRGDPDVLLAQLRLMPDMEYSILWIQRSVMRTAEDREDGKNTPTWQLIPLLYFGNLKPDMYRSVLYRLV